MNEDEFCQCCGQVLITGVTAFFSKNKPYRFKDGYYCTPCAKIYVESKRKEMLKK